MMLHHALNEIIRRTLVSAGIPEILEPVGLSKDNEKRADGMTLIPSWATWNVINMECNVC